MAIDFESERYGYGNCLLGAVRIWLIYGGSFRIIKGMHFIVDCRDGRTRHFRVVKDILPWPLHWMWFWGVYSITQRVTRD